MTDPEMVLVDSNIIFDIVNQDERWAEWSIDSLSQHGQVVVNSIIYAELCYLQTSVDEVDSLLRALGLSYRELPREALFLASKAFKTYRSRGGGKSSPLPDFFIGAHAAALGIPILTRDVARYRTYFPTVPLICPGG